MKSPSAEAKAPGAERFRRGFTLVELLTVVALTSLLVSLLFPALAKARSSAQRAGCASNLKQLGAGGAMYSNDYDDWALRESSDYLSCLSWGRWDVRLIAGGYLGTARDSYNIWVPKRQCPILYCPAMKDVPVLSGAILPGYLISVSFPPNNWTETPDARWRKLGKLKSSNAYFIDQNDGPYHSAMAYWTSSASGWWGELGSLHSGAANALFVGGEVARVSYSAMLQQSWSGWDEYSHR